MIGTFFLPAEDKIQRRKHWIAYVLRPKGYLVLDEGACNALRNRGKSLLSSGIQEVRGEFGVGDVVHCIDSHNQPFAAGLVSYSSANLDIIKRHHSDQIESLLGFKDCDEVIHRDNLVLL